jgi:hypothetical protein
MLLLTRATRRNIPEDGILHSDRRENLKSYKNNGISSRIRFGDIKFPLNIFQSSFIATQSTGIDKMLFMNVHDKHKEHLTVQPRL